MNSENPQDRKSKLNQSPELKEIPEAEVTLETADDTRSKFPDVWLNDDEIIDVEPDVEEIVENKKNKAEAKEELDDWLEQQEDNSAPESIVENTADGTETFAPWLEEEIDNLDANSEEVSDSPQSLATDSPKNVEIAEPIKPQSELIADTWLEESESIANNDSTASEDTTRLESVDSEEDLGSIDSEESEGDDLLEELPANERNIDTDLSPDLPDSVETAAENSLGKVPIPNLETKKAVTSESTDETETEHSSQDLETSDLEINSLERRKANLNAEIKALEAQKAQILLQQAREAQETMGRLVEEGMKELKERKNVLQVEIEKLERRRDRINQEMRRSFAGSSQELAVRVQGFKDYLVGSLQDLATAAEQLQLTRTEPPKPLRERETVRQREPRRERGREQRGRGENAAASPNPQFTEQAFATQTKRIRSLIDRYRTRPDYYGSPWQLRRTFEPIHGKKIQEWFFSQGGRGAIDSMDSRLQNILVASAAISILHELYGDRCRVLVLTDTPEKLGEWRKGLQDCLGISRSDFGSNRGVVLFDAAEVLVQRAERLVKDKQLPFIIIDETEELLNLSLLKFPLWLAFAGTTKSTSSNYLY